MTPLWREAIKPLLDAKSDREIQQRDILARARCFDLREVQPLVRATTEELREGAEFERVEGGGEFWVDIGERVCAPAPITWLEFVGAAVLIDDHSVVSYQLYASPRELRPGLLGNLVLQDGIATVFRAEDPEQPDWDRWREEHGTGMLFAALAGLAIISSPAVKAESVEGHRGLARDIRRTQDARYREIVHTRVTLGGSAPSSSDAPGTGSPKAYHFCRAHARQRANGSVERVRAHWRGDPAFGIRLPSYRMPAPH